MPHVSVTYLHFCFRGCLDRRGSYAFFYNSKNLVQNAPFIDFIDNLYKDVDAIASYTLVHYLFWSVQPRLQLSSRRLVCFAFSYYFVYCFFINSASIQPVGIVGQGSCHYYYVVSRVQNCHQCQWLTVGYLTLAVGRATLSSLVIESLFSPPLFIYYAGEVDLLFFAPSRNN